ncbi:hypothetical protein J2X65_003485 [Ancylobacter sp. 3268]|nr:hypothetical protein [Ancylobacter sp. 3268]
MEHQALDVFDRDAAMARRHHLHRYREPSSDVEVGWLAAASGNPD